MAIKLKDVSLSDRWRMCVVSAKHLTAKLHVVMCLNKMCWALVSRHIAMGEDGVRFCGIPVQAFDTEIGLEFAALIAAQNGLTVLKLFDSGDGELISWTES